MSQVDDYRSRVRSLIAQEWTVRDGQVVPDTTDIVLAGGGVRLTATMLYADLADSTELAMWNRQVAAKVCKAYLECASRMILDCGGAIRSFDGDRVMGVFLGDFKNSNASKCALKINWIFLNIIKSQFEARYQEFSDGSLKLAQTVGVDTSEVLVVRAGVRANNDLIWLGRAPNVAAKLSGIRQSPHHSFVTKEVFELMHVSSKKGKDGRDMWEQCTWNGGPVRDLYRSSWTWSP